MKNYGKKKRAIINRLRDQEHHLSIMGLPAGDWRLETDCVSTGTEGNPSATMIMWGKAGPFTHNKEKGFGMGGHLAIQDVIALRNYLNDVIDLAALDCPICSARSPSPAKEGERE